jgi:hypothetical protein
LPERALECVDTLYRAQLESPTTPRWMGWFTLSNVGLVQMQLGRVPDALQSEERAVKGLLDEHGPSAPLQFARVALAEARWRSGQGAAAMPLLEGIDPTALKSLDPDAPWPQRLALLRGLVLASTGHPQQARELLGRATGELLQAQVRHPAPEPEPLLEDAHKVLAGLR